MAMEKIKKHFPCRGSAFENLLSFSEIATKSQSP